MTVLGADKMVGQKMRSDGKSNVDYSIARQAVETGRVPFELI